MTLGKSVRISDAAARVGPAEFVVLAPGTDTGGAQVLANRLVTLGGTQHVPLRAGVFSSQKGKEEPVAPLDLLNRATEALRKAQTSDESHPVFIQQQPN